MPGFVKLLKKQIYQFLIKYREIPSADNLWKFLKFLVGNKKAPADRTTIGTILAVISEESAKKTPEEERFDCDTLRDPTKPNASTSTSLAKIMSVKPDVDHWYSIENSAEYQLFLSTPSLKQ
jgi:hypothetical protein